MHLQQPHPPQDPNRIAARSRSRTRYLVVQSVSRGAAPSPSAIEKKILGDRSRARRPPLFVARLRPRRTRLLHANRRAPTPGRFRSHVPTRPGAGTSETWLHPFLPPIQTLPAASYGAAGVTSIAAAPQSGDRFGYASPAPRYEKKHQSLAIGKRPGASVCDKQPSSPFWLGLQQGHKPEIRALALLGQTNLAHSSSLLSKTPPRPTNQAQISRLSRSSKRSGTLPPSARPPVLPPAYPSDLKLHRFPGHQMLPPSLPC
ncbi:hypothetical protein HDK77DRAFT_476074 [Phyllosticta capitalensis]